MLVFGTCLEGGFVEWVQLTKTKINKSQMRNLNHERSNSVLHLSTKNIVSYLIHKNRKKKFNHAEPTPAPDIDYPFVLLEIWPSYKLKFY